MINFSKQVDYRQINFGRRSLKQKQNSCFDSAITKHRTVTKLRFWQRVKQTIHRTQTPLWHKVREYSREMQRLFLYELRTITLFIIVISFEENETLIEMG